MLVDNTTSKETVDLHTKEQYNKSKKKIIILGSIVVFIIIGIITVISIISANNGEKVDLNQLYHIEVSGLNGYATAKVVYDSSSYSYSDLESFYKDFATESFLSTISFELSKSENITNGDKLVATANFDNNTAKNLDLNLKNTTITLTVGDLQEGVEVDLFADLEVSFDGTAPFGTVTFTNNNGDDFIRTVTYTSETLNKLKNGDEITVKAQYSETTALEKKVVIKETEKIYIVEGLPEFITDSTVLTEKQKASIDKEVKDHIDSRLANSWESIYSSFNETYAYYPSLEKVSVSEAKIVSKVLLTQKQVGTYYSTFNRVVYIFEVTIDAVDDNYYAADSGGEKTGYIAISMDNITIDLNGDISFTSTSMSAYDWKSSYSQTVLEDSQIVSNKSNYIVTEIN